MTMLQAGSTVELEERLRVAIEQADHSFLHRLYWEQNEFVRLKRFVPTPVVERCVREVDLLEGDIHRNYVPGHKQGGSVSYYTIRKKAPGILALYRSEALRSFLNRLIGGERIEWCPEDDPHSCALYYYTKPGDHIGFHYDTSYYKGARYTVLIGLVEQSEHCRLVARVRKGTAPPEISETRIAMEPGTMVVFNGDKLWHAVTPLGADERRVVLTLQYVTDQRMGPLNKLFSNMKDAFAYFGPAVFMPWAKSRGRS
ncbi:MAG: 2OG-Fe(II) oxygenase [Nitrospira sp.]|nr:2OG-Fe(II) oxygenase [Nitrospira sp.]